MFGYKSTEPGSAFLWQKTGVANIKQWVILSGVVMMRKTVKHLFTVEISRVSNRKSPNV